MRLLIDTNIFLELLLNQERSEEVRVFLTNIDKYEAYISDYSFHSIGTLLFRKFKHDVFRQFLNDIITDAGINIVTIPVSAIEIVINVSQRFNLDFDDAYQYAVAEYYNLDIVSFDSDFDKTEKGRKEPKDLIK